MKSANNKNAFTLIELLIVVAIVGILVSVATVSLISSKNKAISTSVRSSMRSIHPAGVQCRDIGASLRAGTTNSENSICLNTLISGNFPKIGECGSNASDTQYTIINNTADSWQVVLAVCTKSNLCVGAGNAYCDLSGCYFPTGSTCK